MANMNGWKEIILVTARNRQGYLVDKGVYISSEVIANEVYSKLLRKPINHMSSKKIIDFIQVTFETIEAQYELKNG